MQWLVNICWKNEWSVLKWRWYQREGGGGAGGGGGGARGGSGGVEGGGGDISLNTIELQKLLSIMKMNINEIIF